MLSPIKLRGPAGQLEAILKLPQEPPRAAAAVAHPHPLHGGSLHNRVVYAVSRRLEAAGCAVLRFNFRGVGTSAGRHDQGRGERLDMASALAELRSCYPELPLIAAGYSFGCAVALAVGAEGAADDLLGLAPPLSLYDFSFLRQTRVPLAIIAGDADPFAAPAELRAASGQWPTLRSLEILPGVPHDLATDRNALDRAIDRAIAALLGGTNGDLRDHG